MVRLEAPPRELTLFRVSRRAMATRFEVAIPSGTSNALPAAEAALDLIDDIETQLTVYSDESEVSKLNSAGRGPVSETLFQFLEQCSALVRETDGAFDPAAGALVKCWGFFKRQGRVPTETELNIARNSSGFRHVILESTSQSVRFRKPGLELNFGAIGKGYALDRAAELLRNEWGIHSALLHGGGSSVLALGVPPTDFRGWKVAIRHPDDEPRTLGSVYLADQALGTSAATYQYFEYDGKKYGHVIDPRSGRPAEGVRSASCIASTAARADALSTAFFVAGIDWTAEYCRTRPNVSAQVLLEAVEARPFNLKASHFDPPGWRDFEEVFEVD